MKIGEIVENLISIRDRYTKDSIQSREDNALIEACNLLDKLPRMEEATDYKEVLGEIISEA